MSLSDKRSGKLDIITAIALIAVFFLCSYFSLTDGCLWGDDYAAYISEGIALAEGKLDIQSELNTKMHPSPLPDEAVGKPLVYVWGYPLILSLVYSLTGFDRVGFTSVFFYKLPSVIAFALIAAVLFLFLRKRFGYMLSLLLTVAFCSCSDFYFFFNTLYSDMYFMLFSLLSLYVTELYLDCSDHPKHEILGVLLGVICWYMYEIRLNGVAVLLSCLAAHAIFLIREKKCKNWQAILRELLPYIVFFTLKVLSEALIASPTSNTSDLGDGTLLLFLENLKTYSELIKRFFSQMWRNLLINPLFSVLKRIAALTSVEHTAIDIIVTDILTWVSMFLTVLGIVTAGIKKNLHLSLLVILYIVIAAVLPYTQGIRYIFPLLPVILLFFGYGIKALSGILGVPEKKSTRIFTGLIASVLCALCLYQLAANNVNHIYAITEDVTIENLLDVYSKNAYSPDAVEVYNYIRSETPEDCTIAFFAPRGLYLNTERVSVRPGVNGHSPDEADYYLDYLKTDEHTKTSDFSKDFKLIFSNSEFDFYQRISRS